MVKKSFNLVKNEVKESLIENKYILLLSTILFIFPLILGYLLGHHLQPVLEPVLDEFKRKVISGEVKISFDSIFLNNLKAILIEYAGGIFFGILTFFILVFNGLFIGYFGFKVVDLKLFLVGIAPHGIFEIPAVIIGAAAGLVFLSFLVKLIKDIISKNSFDLNQHDYPDETHLTETTKFKFAWNKNYKILKQSLILLVISIFLLIIAAFIETQITVIMINLFK
ncbi:MAG: stage II sporulation protein M [Methanobrevibacter sp.]|jgi:uncharacterized membrane protein SpoIIM required for sporulation|nr:stage II sporulation protein M [Methanobrevibacter sp.]